MLVELSDHHFIEGARVLELLSREVFKEQELLLLVHTPLLARFCGVLLLSELVFRRDRGLELRQRVFVHVKATLTSHCIVSHLPLFCQA